MNKKNTNDISIISTNINENNDVFTNTSKSTYKSKTPATKNKKTKSQKSEPITGEVIDKVLPMNMTNAITPSSDDITLTPSEYFHKIKGMMEENTEENMSTLITNALTLLKKPIITGQSRMAKNIFNTTQVLMKELEAVNNGFTTYVKRETLLYYIDKVSSKVAKIINLTDYEREIPDDVFERLLIAKNIFDDFVVVFTDYTGESERKIEKRKRDKDPILFGLFLVPGEDQTVYFPRFYFIGDWVDQYCDLTLDKMIEEYKRSTGNDMSNSIAESFSLDDVKNTLKEYQDLFEKHDEAK